MPKGYVKAKSADHLQKMVDRLRELDQDVSSTCIMYGAKDEFEMGNVYLGENSAAIYGNFNHTEYFDGEEITEEQFFDRVINKA